MMKHCQFWRLRVALFASAVAACRPNQAELKPIPYSVDMHILDVSVGAVGDPRDRCGEVAAAVFAATTNKSARTYLYVLATGEKGSEEPSIVFDGILATSNNIWGDKSEAKKQKAELLLQIQRTCEEKIGSARKSSPIYRAVVRAKSALDNICRSLEHEKKICASRHRLTIHSDLRETENVRIKAVIDRGEVLSRVDEFKVDLSKFDVNACGVSATKEKAVKPEVIEDVWRHLFGEEMTFSPACRTYQHEGSPS